jgi:AcrR family transcriptional regulator
VRTGGCRSPERGARVSCTEVANRATPLAWNRNQEPAGGRPATSKRTRGLSTEAIVAGAIRIADADGLDAVTMRRLAAELGSRPTSLYAHIASKADLLALMANELIGLMLVDKPLADDWREALRELSRRMHAVFVAHPWAPQLFGRRPGMGPNAVRRAKQLARAVAGVPLEPAEVWTLLAIVDDYVMGNALRVATGANDRDSESAITSGDLVEFPELAALPSSELVRSHIERFEIGLDAVLDGVQRRFLSSH